MLKIYLFLLENQHYQDLPQGQQCHLVQVAL